MFRPARPLAPPRFPARRSLTLAVAIAAAAVCGCCSRGYAPYGATPGYYGQPGYGQPQFVPQPGVPTYGQPQFTPQPIPGTLPPQGGTILGPPSGGVPALPAPDDGFSFPDTGDFEDLGTPDFGTTPAGGTGGNDPFYPSETGGYGPTPTGGGDPVPPLEDYDPLGVDDSPNPGGVQNFEPPPPGDSPFEGFEDPAPGDFNSSTGTGARPGLAAAPARLPNAPARPLLGANAPRHDPSVRPAGAVRAAAGPSRTVTGVVDHDAATNAWTLTYSMSPEPTDRFGGALTLLDDGHLAGLEGEKGLIVAVEGRLDPAAGPDALGKPRFRVETATEKGYYEGP